MAAHYQIAIIALAAWRLSSLIARESGPNGVLDEWRDRLPDNVRDGVECIWCNSVWIGVLATVIYVAGLWYVTLPLSVSAVVILLEALCAIVEEET